MTWSLLYIFDFSTLWFYTIFTKMFYSSCSLEAIFSFFMETNKHFLDKRRKFFFSSLAMTELKIMTAWTLFNIEINSFVFSNVIWIKMINIFISEMFSVLFSDVVLFFLYKDTFIPCFPVNIINQDPWCQRRSLNPILLRFHPTSLTNYSS